MRTLKIRGILLDDSVNLNGWQIQAEDFHIVAADALEKQIRVDHADLVQKVVGKITKTEVHKPHGFRYKWDAANRNSHVMFEGLLYIADNNILVPLIYKLVNSVSLSADADVITCSKCGKRTRPVRKCDCDGHEILRDAKVKEVSLVVSPAYQNTHFSIIGET